MVTEDLLKKYKRQTTVQLLGKYKKLSGDDREACLQVLELRGKDTSDLRGVVEDVFKKVGDTYVVEVAPETSLTEDEALQVLESEEKFEEKKPVEVVKTKKESVIEVTKKVTKIPELTDEQRAKIDLDIERFKEGELSKKQLVISWMEFGIMKQQIDKFVDPKVVSWSYAYPIYKVHGK